MIPEKKSVLFICPAFFGYEISIKNALKENGYDVDFFDERTSNGSIAKAIFRVKKSLLNRAVNRYYSNIIEKIKLKRYDYFLLIKGEVVPESFIVEFKKNNPFAKLIYYTYDSFHNNNSNSIFILKHFDVCYSFDFEDVKNNHSLKLKHLFYTQEYLVPTGKREKKHEIAFVGTLHSARYPVIKELFSKFSNTYAFFYMPAKWFYIFERLFKKDFKKVKMSDVSFKKLSRQQVADIFKDSKSVLDIQRFGQTGLTMRTFEVLASGTILITTNSYIRQAEFYDPNHIIVLDMINSGSCIEEIKKKIQNESATSFNRDFIPEKYFINNWVKEFFE
jgi:hypothetical protein